VLEVLEAIPSYKPGKITKEDYDKAVWSFQQHLNRALELYRAWWKSGDALLLDMSLEELLKAGRFMDSIVYAVGDEKVVEKLSKRATFMYDLTGAMMGQTDD